MIPDVGFYCALAYFFSRERFAVRIGRPTGRFSSEASIGFLIPVNPHCRQ
jgi:hypothetical protein